MQYDNATVVFHPLFFRQYVSNTNFWFPIEKKKKKQKNTCVDPYVTLQRLESTKPLLAQLALESLVFNMYITVVLQYIAQLK